MNTKNKTRGPGSKIIGGILFVVASFSVFLIDWKPEVEAGPEIIRPLKTLVAGEAASATAWEYPGKVSAGEEAIMAFEVAGTVKELLVKESDEVEKGQLLARLDDRDYVNQQKSAQAELDRAKAQLDRMKKAAESNAVSEQEVSDAQAAFDKAKAELDIKTKALEDTELRASFAGTIAQTYVKNFENVNAKQEILSLQDLNTIEIKASIPESRIAQLNPAKLERKEMKDKITLLARFDYFPDRTFEVKPKEFATQADPATQTYTATFVMDAPEDVTILPGMTAMVAEPAKVNETSSDEMGLLLPLYSVPVDGLGQYYVWLVEKDEGDIYKVSRKDVDVGEITGENIVITAGISRGDRVAAAGVRILQEGQRVKLLSAGS